MGYLSHQKFLVTVLLLLCARFAQCAENKTESMVTSESNNAGTNETATTESSNDSKHDLDKAESKDPNKLEIIKQIRKINPDGSYTIGYEAEDGTFKIESRDVLGNVKGTYGYVDENGEIKRVSYTANNATGLKTMPLDTTSEETSNVPRVNRTYSVSSTRRPTPRTNVQSIPRRRYPYSDRNSNVNKLGQEVNSLSPEPTTTVVYATSLSTPKPVILVRPTNLPFPVKDNNEEYAQPVEINHISKVAKNAHMDLKASDDRSGTNARRQLPENENFETQQQIIYGQSAGDDNTHIYGGGPGGVTVRPLYTSTPVPRVPAAVLQARQRAVQLQNIINKSPTTTTERVYAKPPKRAEVAERKIEQSTEANNRPVVQIPANNDIHEVAEDERRYFKERPTYQPQPREYVRYVPTTVLPLADQRQAYRMPPPAGFARPTPDEQYLRETTRASQRQAPPYPEDEQPDDYQQVRPVAAANGYQQQSYLNPYAVAPYRNPLYDFPDRPLTARDFERLLQLLIYRHSQLQQYQRGYGYPGINPYGINPSAYPPVGGPVGGVGGYYGGYQIPRPPYYNPYYDPRYENLAYSNPSSQRQYPSGQPAPTDPQAGYSQTQAPTTEPEQGGYYDNQQRQVPRRRMYGSRPPLPPPPPYNEADYASNTNQLGAGPSDGYLPPNVREDLLYRMFMLALRSDPGSLPAASNIEPTTISPVTSRKPVRSVQILGEEDA